MFGSGIYTWFLSKIAKPTSTALIVVGSRVTVPATTVLVNFGSNVVQNYTPRLLYYVANLIADYRTGILKFAATGILINIGSTGAFKALDLGKDIVIWTATKIVKMPFLWTLGSRMTTAAFGLDTLMQRMQTLETAKDVVANIASVTPANVMKVITTYSPQQVVDRAHAVAQDVASNVVARAANQVGVVHQMPPSAVDAFVKAKAASDASWLETIGGWILFPVTFTAQVMYEHPIISVAVLATGGAATYGLYTYYGSFTAIGVAFVSLFKGKTSDELPSAKKGEASSTYSLPRVGMSNNELAYSRVIEKPGLLLDAQTYVVPTFTSIALYLGLTKVRPASLHTHTVMRPQSYAFYSKENTSERDKEIKENKEIKAFDVRIRKSLAENADLDALVKSGEYSPSAIKQLLEADDYKNKLILAEKIAVDTFNEKNSKLRDLHWLIVQEKGSTQIPYTSNGETKFITAGTIDAIHDALPDCKYTSKVKLFHEVDAHIIRVSDANAEVWETCKLKLNNKLANYQEDRLSLERTNLLQELSKVEGDARLVVDQSFTVADKQIAAPRLLPKKDDFGTIKIQKNKEESDLLNKASEEVDSTIKEAEFLSPLDIFK